MTNGPLRYYNNGALVGTVIDPRFGAGATPTQPEGWGGTVDPGESGGAVDAGHLMVVNGGTVTLPVGALVGDLAGYRVTAPATFTDGTLSVTLHTGGYIFELTSTGWTYLALPAPARMGGAPTPGSLLVQPPTDKAIGVVVQGAYDDMMLHAQPYCFSSDGGTTWTGWKAAPGHLFRTTAGTSYDLRHAVRDAAENVTEAPVVQATSASAGQSLGPWNIISGFTQDGEYLSPSSTGDCLAWRTATSLSTASVRAVVTSERSAVSSGQMLSGPVFRYVDANNFLYYSFGSAGANYAELHRVVAGVDSQIIRWTPGIDYNNKEIPFVARVDIAGNQITCFDRNGVTPLGTATVTEHAASNNVGLRKGSTMGGGAAWSLTVY